MEANDKWSLALPVVQLALNIRLNSRIKSSAFEVVHGRPFNGFLDFQGVQETQELQELIAKRLEHNSALRWFIYPELASRNRDFKQEKYTKADQKIKQAVDVQPGDLVYAKDMTRGSKWDPVYEGPFTVIRQNEGKAYILADATGTEIQPARTIDQLKLVGKAVEETSTGGEDLETEELKGNTVGTHIVGSDEKERQDGNSEEDLPEPSSRNKQKLDNRKKVWKPKEEHFEVQQILNDRIIDGKQELLVLWKGYGAEDNSWVKAEDFDDTKIIKQYWKDKRTGNEQEIKKIRSSRQRRKK